MLSLVVAGVMKENTPIIPATSANPAKVNVFLMVIRFKMK
jgi:hypothetical protein